MVSNYSEISRLTDTKSAFGFYFANFRPFFICRNLENLFRVFAFLVPEF